ncbi:hypothetical protein [Pontiella agarivorans]|uniref:Uncharacterized protein n=1 Tax=Pontiella agarivorans TaxID=3038953 RepID=A0ABU5MVA5_9BACT|nr:hypothetical protein [Pontiella agarivorans]MDZ8118161.1 hypothetical protein [Pontiella agarivorans]
MNTKLLPFFAAVSGLVQSVSAQTFLDPGYTGETQFAQWSSFTYAETNAGVNIPQWETGSPNLELRQFNPALITSSGNIYSFSSNLSFELTGSSTNVLGKVGLQFFTWGEADALSNETVRLELDGGMSLSPDSLTNFYQFVDDQGSYGAYHTLGYKLEWDLSGLNATNYTIRFDTVIHSSLDELRLDTEAGVPAAPVPELEITFSGSDPVLHFTGEPGVLYQLICSQSLTNALTEWAVVAGPVSGDGSTVSITNSTLNAQGFYAVEAWLE